MINIQHGPKDWYLTKHNTELAGEALESRVKCVRKYDVPDLAGLSNDGKTFYVDQDCPKECKYPGGEIDIDCCLLVHETVEYGLLKAFPSLTYQDAHQIACLAEKEYVEMCYGMGAWEPYSQLMRVQCNHAWNKKHPKPPSDLYKKPYVDEHQYKKLREMGYIKNEAPGV